MLIIGGRLQAVERAKELGLGVVLLQHPDRLVPGQAEAAHALILADFTDWEGIRPLIIGAVNTHGIRRVVSVVETGMETVGRINDLFGLKGTSYEVARRFKDKLAMRRRLAELGVEEVGAARVGSGEQLRGFADRHGYPCVLKPVDGTGSRGVRLVSGPGEADAAWEWACGVRGNADLKLARLIPVDAFIVEEYLAGPEYSVETFSFDGRHVVVAITEKLTSGTVETGHAQPARLSPQDEDAVVRHVGDCLDALGLTEGPAHTEVILTAAGPRLVEAHDRVGGGRILDLVKHVHGIDLEQYAVGAPFGLVPDLLDRPAARGAAATRFLGAEPGTVVSVEGVEAVRSRPEVLDVSLAVGVGDRVVPVRDNLDRIGQLIVAGEDTASAVAACAELAAGIRITTRPETGTGTHP